MSRLQTRQDDRCSRNAVLAFPAFFNSLSDSLWLTLPSCDLCAAQALSSSFSSFLCTPHVMSAIVAFPSTFPSPAELEQAGYLGHLN